MTPERRSYTVTVHYWACADPAHRHTTEAIAQRCLERLHPGCQGRPKLGTYPSIGARNRDIMRAGCAGEPPDAIARRHGLSPGRVRYILHKAIKCAGRAFLFYGSSQPPPLQVLRAFLDDVPLVPDTRRAARALLWLNRP